MDADTEKQLEKLLGNMMKQIAENTFLIEKLRK